MAQHNVDRSPVVALDPDAIPFWPSTAAFGPDTWVVVPADVLEESVVTAEHELYQSGCPPPAPGPYGCHDLPVGSWPAVIEQLGGFCFATNQYFATGVPAPLSSWHIGNLGLLAHVVALRVWGSGWSGRAVNVLSDDEDCRHLLGDGRTRDPRRLQVARIVVGLQFSGNFRIESARPSTDQDTLADALSRLGDGGVWQRFLTACSASSVVPHRVAVPEDVFYVPVDAEDV